jgi:hypothetical protein
MDSLQTGGVGGLRNPHKERLNAVFIKLPEPRRLRFLELKFKNCGWGTVAQRFCFLHVRGPPCGTANVDE